VPTRHLVIGAGEVGTALHTVLNTRDVCEIRDVDPIDYRADVIHIAFPWSDAFVEHVQRYAAEHGAELVVVHSTVPVGTCDANGWVHSPVRGRHTNLVGGLRKFVKHRSEERRVGEGCGSRWEPWACTKESVEAACR